MEWRLAVSRHARTRMEERGVTLQRVEEILRDPYTAFFYDTWRDVYVAVASTGEAVVYSVRGSRIEVVTVLGRREAKALLSKYGRSRYRHVDGLNAP